MKLIDMTHLIKEDMPVFPGTEKPILKTANTIVKDGFKETLLSMFSHTGTHMDAPSHIFENKKNLDQFDLEHFSGKAMVLDFEYKKEGEIISLEEIISYDVKLNDLEYVIIKTGWDKYWGDDKYYGKFPVLSNDAAIYLSEKNLKGIGLDVISLDSMNDALLKNHRAVLSKEMVIIENLTNLGVFRDEIFTVYFMPLKYKGSDGAPVRAFGAV